MQGFKIIPFTTDGAHGFTSVNGVAKFSSAGVVLEFESKFLGLISNGIKEVGLPVGDILDVKFKKGFMKRGAKIEIRLKSFTQLAEVPNKEGKIALKLLPDDLERARDAVDQLERDMAEQAASLPPPHPPLRSLFDESENTTRDLNR